MKKIAHRGLYSKKVKENTLSAIYNALINDDYIGVEFDVRVTKDREFVVFHDAFFKDKLIKNLNFYELPKFVPRLEDILKINSKKIFLIEIKYLDKEYKRLIKLLNKYAHKNLYVVSFYNKIINNLNIKEKKYKLGILNYLLNNKQYEYKLDFVCIINSLLNNYIIDLLQDYEVFSYGGIKNKKYKEVYYII